MKIAAVVIGLFVVGLPYLSYKGCRKFGVIVTFSETETDGDELLRMFE